MNETQWIDVSRHGGRWAGRATSYNARKRPRFAFPSDQQVKHDVSSPGGTATAQRDEIDRTIGQQ